jgi:hypothetical protein
MPLLRRKARMRQPTRDSTGGDAGALAGFRGFPAFAAGCCFGFILTRVADALAIWLRAS